jgi:hypothetical protein
MNIPPDQLEICLNVLQQISEDPAVIGEHDRFKSLIAKIYKQDAKVGVKLNNNNDELKIANSKHQPSWCSISANNSHGLPYQNQQPDRSICTSPSFVTFAKHPIQKFIFFIIHSAQNVLNLITKNDNSEPI